MLFCIAPSITDNPSATSTVFFLPSCEIYVIFGIHVNISIKKYRARVKSYAYFRVLKTLRVKLLINNNVIFIRFFVFYDDN